MGQLSDEDLKVWHFKEAEWQMKEAETEPDRPDSKKQIRSGSNAKDMVKKVKRRRCRLIVGSDSNVKDNQLGEKE